MVIKNENKTTPVCSHTLSLECAHARTHARTHAHTHTHTHTHTHARTPPPPPPPPPHTHTQSTPPKRTNEKRNSLDKSRGKNENKQTQQQQQKHGLRNTAKSCLIMVRDHGGITYQSTPRLSQLLTSRHLSTPKVQGWGVAGVGGGRGVSFLSRSQQMFLSLSVFQDNGQASPWPLFRMEWRQAEGAGG